jgi:hypothetical protein
VDTNPAPPAITQQPANTTIVQGGYGALTAAASGTKPLFYQWLFGNVPIPNATNTTLNLTNVTPASAGNYSVLVTNVAGSTNSAAAVLTIAPAALTPALEKIWQLPPGSRFFLANDSNQRGLAYNAANGHVLVASRTPTNGIHVLDGETGTYLHSLQMDNALITGGVITLNLVGCTVDGQVFAGNVVLDGANATTPFKLYTWLNDDPSTAPTLAWSGDPGSTTTNRWGDTMDVRGTFDNPEILLGSRFGVQTAIIPVAFGVGATPQTFTHTGVPGAAFGLGVAFGRGDTIWGKTSGGPLLQVALDYGAFNSTVLRSNFAGLPNLTALQVAVEDDLLAAVSPLETPDNVRLYDVADSNAAPAALDTEFFPTDNLNVNGTGALAFGPCRLYALDSNNGLVAFRVAPLLRSSVSGGMLSLSWTVGALQSTTDIGDPNSWTNVPSATTPYPVNTTSPGRAFFRLAK